MSDPTARRSGLLVIGYGNELRGDDGVGPKVASAVNRLNLPGVRSIACHQLTPELADPVSRAAGVVFVDATAEAGTGIRMQELKPEEPGQPLAHAADPRTVLALARDVFGSFPAAWWLTIPIETTELGDELSPFARSGLRQAVDRIRTLASGL